MNLLKPALSVLVACAAASSASAQSNTDTAGPFPVIGTVPAMCSAGSVGEAQGTFDLGVLIDTSTGLLRDDLSAPPKILTGAFCSARSNISIEATPLFAENNLETPSSGFSRRVNYVASASGWTPTAASFSTGQTSNPAATQQRATAFQGDITVAISDFSTAGGDNLRLVADPSYKGAVTVTLAVAD
jgi:hypothetical protein